VRKEGDILTRYSAIVGENVTNNIAEYEALIKALELASKYTKEELTCFLDSELVVKQLLGEYRVRNQRLMPLFLKVQKLQENFKKIIYQHVSRWDNFQQMAGSLRRKYKVHVLRRRPITSSFGAAFLDVLLEDDRIEEISVIGVGKPTYVYVRDKGWQKVNACFTEERAIMECINKLAHRMGRRITLQNLEALEREAKDLQVRYQVKVDTVLFDACDYSSHKKFYEELETRPDIVVVAFGFLGDQQRAQTDFDEFRKITGVPVLLNTSFNENEPIVCRPKEALECFLRTKMDMLVMGNFILKKEES